jgi:hypothetical protein
MKLLTEQDYARAAERLGWEVAAVKAVAEVESRGAGFLADGRPKILFERHIFRRELLKRGIDTRAYEREQPELVNVKPGGYKGGAEEWRRLDDAVHINRDAALSSASWGKFQIMGFNWKASGAASIQDFVNRMYRSEGAQLDAFVEFVKDQGIDDEVQRHDWAAFAEKYNGPGYDDAPGRANDYDTKLADAYARHA